MSEFNDLQALAGLRDLNSQAVGAIYDQYFSEIYRYVRYRVDDDSLAEDLTSEVFMRLLEAANKRQAPQTSVKGWLIATASNAVNDHLRKQYRHPESELPESMTDHNSDVPARVDSREEARTLRTAMTSLTEEQQDVLALRFGQGYSLEETAGYLNKKVNAVKALQFRALASLQRQIGEAAHE
ncbi:MAG: sigma-70 family RNA polymerase sigma factor [Anaerolineales bacterium]|nr:sigma-70 family RNA polymerase sigma factor [Anaerolineales bacterium]